MSATAYSALAAGDVAIVPTDTVYGLAALPGSDGYEKIFALKKRPAAQVLPWLVSGADSLDTYAADVNPAARRLAGRFWPGALTIVVRASERARELGPVASDGTVALRCPDEPTCLNLLEQLGMPLCCTSANLHGAPAVSRRVELDPSFAGVAGFDELPDCCRGGKASTIVDCTGETPQILREGPIPEQLVREAAGFDATLESVSKKDERG
ncbi:MAG: L-threonylcarbamoyladenylate synthase [Coriobacteriales bacterium]